MVEEAREKKKSEREMKEVEKEGRSQQLEKDLSIMLHSSEELAAAENRMIKHSLLFLSFSLIFSPFL